MGIMDGFKYHKKRTLRLSAGIGLVIAALIVGAAACLAVPGSIDQQIRVGGFASILTAAWVMFLEWFVDHGSD